MLLRLALEAQIRHEDTIETAQTMFRLLNVVVERLITEPKQIDAMFDALPETKKTQVEKRDGTGA